MTQIKFLIAGVLILGSLVFLIYTGISKSMVRYYDVSQLLKKSSQIDKHDVRLTGQGPPLSIAV